MRKPRIAESALVRTRIRENTAPVATALTSRARTRTEKTAAAAAARISLLLARMNKLMWLLHNAVVEAALMQYGCELPLLELNKTVDELSSLPREHKGRTPRLKMQTPIPRY